MNIWLRWLIHGMKNTILEERSIYLLVKDERAANFFFRKKHASS